MGISAGHIMLLLVILTFVTSKLEGWGKGLGGAVMGFKDAMNVEKKEGPQKPLRHIAAQSLPPAVIKQKGKETV